MKIFIFIFILFIVSVSISTTSKAEKNNKLFNKKDLLITTITVINPVLSISAIFSNANAVSKILSMGNLAYSSIKGKTITESALSQSFNKKCLIENLSNNKDFCI